MQLVGGAAVIFEITRQGRHIGAGLGNGLAIVSGLEPGQRLGLGLDATRQPQHQPPAFRRRQMSPFACQRRAGGGNGGIHVLGTRLGDGGEGRAVDGRVHRHLAPRRRRPPHAADQVQGLGQDQRSFHHRLLSKRDSQGSA